LSPVHERRPCMPRRVSDNLSSSPGQSVDGPEETKSNTQLPSGTLPGPGSVQCLCSPVPHASIRSALRICDLSDLVPALTTPLPLAYYVSVDQTMTRPGNPIFPRPHCSCPIYLERVAARIFLVDTGGPPNRPDDLSPFLFFPFLSIDLWCILS
jgi:hypothetical protein